MLLNIHGGPFAQYTVALFDEAQVYAGAGYAVLMCNPRGSAGYGQDHGRAIKERMGTVDMQDVLAFLDGAAGEVLLRSTPDAVGIMGGSYGGYLTAWTIASDHRFKAAIVERGFLDPVSFKGSSDIGWFFGGEYIGRSADRWRRRVPMAHVDSGPDTHPGDPQRGRPALPGGTGPAVLHCAEAEGRGTGVPGLPGRGPRTLPVGNAASPPAAVRAHPALVGPVPADGGEPRPASCLTRPASRD